MESDMQTDKFMALHGRLNELMRQQRELVEHLQYGQFHFKELARSVWRLQEEERRRLARELHDGIGQNLTVILGLIDQARQLASDQTKMPLENARALVDATLSQTRELSRLLRPQILDDLGIESALRWLTRTLSETHLLQIQLDLDGSLSALGPELSTLVFRVTQEALSNAIHHARAKHAQVSLRMRQRGLLQLEIDDDGVGCDVHAALAADRGGRGSGIGGMRDRVRAYDGEFNIRSAPGEGFHIAIAIPLADMVSAAKV